MLDDYPDIFDPKIWITIGITYHAAWQKYALIKVDFKKATSGLCLACTEHLHSSINTFCFECKVPRPCEWTTGNKSLDAFIMKSWNSVGTPIDSYIQWIEFTQLTNIQEELSLEHECTHVAEWLEPTIDGVCKRKTMIKMITEGQNAEMFDFNQVKVYAVKNISNKLC